MPIPLPPSYPAGGPADFALRDRSSIRIRPLQSSDHDAMRTFFGRLSSDSIPFRIFGFANLDRATNQWVDVDYGDRYRSS